MVLSFPEMEKGGGGASWGDAGFGMVTSEAPLGQAGGSEEEVGGYLSLEFRLDVGVWLEMLLWGYSRGWRYSTPWSWMGGSRRGQRTELGNRKITCKGKPVRWDNPGKCRVLKAKTGHVSKAREQPVMLNKVKEQWTLKVGPWVGHRSCGWQCQGQFWWSKGWTVHPRRGMEMTSIVHISKSFAIWGTREMG